MCIANFTPLVRAGYRVGLPWAGEWKVILDTDMARSGAAAIAASGPGVGAELDNPDVVIGTLEIPYQTLEASAQVDVGPMSMLWLASTAPPRAPT